MDACRETLKVTGGGVIGRMQGSWPIARLTVTRNLLVVDAGLCGRYPFRPQDVAALESAGLFGRELHVDHNVPGYPCKVVFVGWGRAEALLARIERVGFHPMGGNAQTTPAPMDPQMVGGWGFPFRRWFWIAVVLAWNGLILADLVTGRGLGILSACALGLVIGLGAGVMLFPPLRRTALRPYHTVGVALVGSLAFLMLISGLMLLLLVTMGYLDVRSP